MKNTMKTHAEKTPFYYEQPRVIYDGTITTRAGSPLGGGDAAGSADGVDPADLFD